MPDESKTPHEDICKAALKHYDQISTEVCDWFGAVPEAIKYYSKKESHVDRAELQRLIMQFEDRLKTIRKDHAGLALVSAAWFEFKEELRK